MQMLAITSLLFAGVVQAQSPLGEYERVNWSNYWNEPLGDWEPVAVCQGDCEGLLYDDEYCQEGLECRLATVEDASTCSGLALVGAYYCFPSSDEEENEIAFAQEASTNGTLTAFTWGSWTFDEELDTWTLPACGGGCDEWDGYCEGDNICVLTTENFENPFCTGTVFLDEYYCVPPEQPATVISGGEAIVEAQEATIMSYTYEEWFRDEMGEWKLPTCGAGCEDEDEYCSDNDVCVWEGSSGSCEGESEDGWYYCIPPS